MKMTASPSGFHGKFGEECLNEHWFLTLDNARDTIESWRIDCGQVRPHSALNYLTPEEFATGYAAKLNPECSHLRGLTEGGSSVGTHPHCRRRHFYKRLIPPQIN